MFERYTDAARRILFFSRYEASQLGSISIHPEHVLLGLLRTTEPHVERVLRDAGLSEEKVRAEVAKETDNLGPLSTSVEIPFAAQTKRVLQYAAEEADRLDHPHIGAEHLLLGLLRESGTAAERILAQAGLHADPVRKQIREAAVSQTADPRRPLTRADALAAVERISTRLYQLARADRPEVFLIIESISKELNLVRQVLRE